MLLTEIDHIAIAVKDLEAAIAYYAEAFGAEVHHREIVESDGVEEALVKVADSYIQLTAATRPDSPIAKSIEKIYGQNAQNIGLLTSTDFSLIERIERGGRSREHALLRTTPLYGGPARLGDLRVVCHRGSKLPRLRLGAGHSLRTDGNFGAGRAVPGGAVVDRSGRPA